MRQAWAMAALATTLAACSPTPQPPAPAAEPAAPAHAPQPVADATPAPPTPPAVTAAAAAAGAVESWELPGTLGPMTTQAQLEARFGKVNLREETVPGPEGDGSTALLVVFPYDPKKRLELVLDADDRDAPIQALRVAGRNSLWHDHSGLYPGMTLAELVTLNGAPVSFYGLGWDYGGSVQDWHGGRLANAVGSPLFHAVTLAAREGADESALPMGDGTFRSDDARHAGIGQDLVIGELAISWPHDDE